MMRFGRTIVVFLVALSVAMLPAAGALASIAKSAELAASEMAADCCDHHGAPCDDTSKAKSDCASMAACAAHCFNYAGTVLSVMIFAPTGAAVQPIRSGNTVVSRTSTPPFRPPRI